MELDIKAIFKMLLKHVAIIVVVSLLAATVVYYYMTYRVEPTFRATVRMVVQINNGNDVADVNYATAGNLSTAQKMADTCSIIFKDVTFLTELNASLGNKYSTSKLSNMISISSVSNSEILGIGVQGTNPSDCADIANAFLKTAPAFLRNIYTNATVVPMSPASPPRNPAAPNVKKNTLVALLVAFAGSCGAAFLVEFLNTKIKSEDNLSEMYDIPVFAEIPSFDDLKRRISSDGGEYYSGGYSKGGGYY